MKIKRRPAILLNRIPHELEEFVALYFAAGPTRDAARRLWFVLEESFKVDLRGLHPDDDLNELLTSANSVTRGQPIGSFSTWVEEFKGARDSLDELVLSQVIEDRLNQPWFTLGNGAL